MCNTWEKQLVMYIASAIDTGFFLNNEYRISEKIYRHTSNANMEGFRRTSLIYKIN